MKKLILISLTGVCVLGLAALLTAQPTERKVVEVPYVTPSAMTINGVMDEPAWGDAAQANLITASGYEIWTNKYYRESLTEPDYDEYYARMLWSEDTLYVFIHIDEIVNDSTDLFWPGQWSGDQLFVGLSNRLGVDLQGWYDGNVYAAPDGPYHFLIMGDQLTLNAGNETYIPEEWRCTFADSQRVFDAGAIARMATTIDLENGVWDVELAIYNPHVNGQSCIGFNIGGSTGSTQAHEQFGDAYAYYCWQPNVPDDPYGDPVGANDPGYYTLVTSQYWAILKFVPPPEVVIRKEVNVPMVDPGTVVIDGLMEEVWSAGAQANLITASGYEIWTNKYYRESLTEPDYDEYYARMLWSEDTLYVFIHIDEIVNDSTDLFWPGQWSGDQLFVGLSNRLGVDLQGWYDGNVYAAPDGPYHFLIMGDQLTLNAGNETYIPEEWRCTFADSQRVFDAGAIARMATTIDLENGVWDVELAIYNPHVNGQSCIGFNIGGSTGSTQAHEQFGDAYAYYCWQPNVPDDPYGDPVGANDPGYYTLVTSQYWAILNFVLENVTSVELQPDPTTQPVRFSLSQNYPNPFNPSTTIRFDLAKTGPVTLKVYNVLGQLVATLIDNKTLSSGTYSVTWNAENLSSGVYIYRIEAGGVVETRKMTLMK